MFSKPFRPPLLKKPSSEVHTGTHSHSTEHAPKRRRISEDSEDSDDDESHIKHSPRSIPLAKLGSTPRIPLIPLRNPPSPEAPKRNEGGDSPEGYYMVLWRNHTKKKNKTWDADGLLAVKGGFATLYNTDGSQLGRTASKGLPSSESILSIGGKDVELDCPISREEFLARKPSVNEKANSEKPLTDDPNSLRLIPSTSAPLPPKPKLSIQEQMKAAMAKEKEGSKKTLNVSQSNTKATKAAFRNPLRENKTTMTTETLPADQPKPLYDPTAPGALVFKRPKSVPKGKRMVDVVLDPHIGRHLREHQREGVQFLYECVMGLRDFDGQGCILADDMGLGKTLQTIALLWTLLQQNPVYEGGPVIRKALIVCPVTLIDNWRKEFKKWARYNTMGVFVVDQTKKRLTDFTHGKTYSVMIIGYERLRSVAEDLTKGAGIDIVIADEGHRLKTLKNKSTVAIETLNTPRKVILSGTPIQNDLSEFFAMVNFVNEGLLGNYKSFEKTYERPILKARQPNALEEDIQRGDESNEELAQMTSPFILRRTADILSKYLPPRTEYVLFCKPTPDQASIYRQIVNTPMFQGVLGASSAGETGFQLITILKKLCNSPSLLLPRAEDAESASPTSLTNLLDMLPDGLYRKFRNHASTKIRLLDQLLHQIRKFTDEKVVLVSNYTATLDLMATLLNSTGLPYLRLDGSTPAAKRQGLVDDFNRSKASSCFAFLLSAKAGGLGLNLIGGSRLILFDVDWNPAVDDQAMARIHRQGQKRHCKIYRFMVKGGLEERIWQRQVVKRSLADSIMDGGSSAAAGTGSGSGKKGSAPFSQAELRDLFRLDESERLKTHDLIGCGCGGRGTRLAEDGQDLVGDGDSPASMDESAEGDSDSSEELPDISTLVKASRLKPAAMDEQESKISSGKHPKQVQAKRKQEEEMQALMEYLHLETGRISGLEEDSEELIRVEGVVDDECLMNVLRQDGETTAGGIAYLFKKTSGSRVELGEEVEIKKEVVKSSFFT